MARKGYDHRKVEEVAQKKWAGLDLYSTDLRDEEKEPYYLLIEFPYPSGDLHIGHWYAYVVPDIYARFKRMQGRNVLFPIGFDAFGLPAENAAMKNGADPRRWTEENMARMREQIRSMGTSLDWSKEVVTCDPSYYTWTQWLFLKFFEQGLAERREAPVKWCPKDRTVLANEQVIDGACERCGTEVEEKQLTQWFLKITKYADRLLRDLDALPWREDIKEAQRAWIGESEGAKLTFSLETAATAASLGKAEVFTTRPDTIFGATYLVLAPEHPMVEGLIDFVQNPAEVRAYRETTSRKTERERSENKDKTGVALAGVVAVNPASGERIPVYIADYVLASYGTGAVMAVPAHDERDFEFARRFRLPVRHVIAPRRVDERNPHLPDKELVKRNIIVGIVRNPKTGNYLGLSWKKQGWISFITGGIEEGEDMVETARREIAEETGYTNLRYVRTLGGPVHVEFYAAHKDVNRIAYANHLLFELEDETRAEVSKEEQDLHEALWLDEGKLTRDQMDHAQMDLILERLRSDDCAYTDDGVLINSGTWTGRDNREVIWEMVESIGGERVKNYRIRDWLVSRQRYWGCPIPIVYDPEGAAHPVPPEHLPWLLPEDVDFTTSDAAPLASSQELKERVTKLFGEGWTPECDTLDTFVDSSWYYLRYLDSKDEGDFSDQAMLKKWLPIERYSGGSEHTTMHLLYARFFHKALYDLALVPESEPFVERYNRGIILGPDGQKMSKRWGNVVNPDDVVKQYGADAVRVYYAFMAPYNESGHYVWSDKGVESARRFLDRIASLADTVGDADASEALMQMIARTARKIAEDAERFKFNTAVAALMVLVREFEGQEEVSRTAYHDLLRLVAPFAPHLAEHLWEETGGERSVHEASWPEGAIAASAEATVIVQVNGKKRGELLLAVDAGEEEAVAAARGLEAVEKALAGQEIAKTVYVPGRILNLVVV